MDPRDVLTQHGRYGPEHVTQRRQGPAKPKLITTLESGAVLGEGGLCDPVWNSTTGLGGPDQTSEFSSSVKSKSNRLIFGRIDCSHRVLEAKPKKLRRNIRVRSH